LTIPLFFFFLGAYSLFFYRLGDFCFLNIFCAFGEYHRVSLNVSTSLDFKIGAPPLVVLHFFLLGGIPKPPPRLPVSSLVSNPPFFFPLCAFVNLDKTPLHPWLSFRIHPPFVSSLRVPAGIYGSWVNLRAPPPNNPVCVLFPSFRLSQVAFCLGLPDYIIGATRYVDLLCFSPPLQGYTIPS